MEFLIGIVILYILYKYIVAPFIEGYRTKKVNIDVQLDSDDEIHTQSKPRTTQVSANLTPEVYIQLNSYCDKSNKTKTEVINSAVERYLADNK